MALIFPRHKPSSVVRRLAYETDFRELYIEFRRGPSIWRYKGVDTPEAQAFFTADSLGSHFSKHIRNRYPEEQQDLDWWRELVATGLKRELDHATKAFIERLRAGPSATRF